MGDWLNDLMAEVAAEEERERPIREARLAELKAERAKLSAEREKWMAKVYKPNASVHYTRDEIPTTTYGTINERRRRRRIEMLSAEIERLDAEIAELE